MTQKTLIPVLFMLVAILLLVSSCARSKKPYSKEDLMEKITGDWKNTEYNRSDSPARRVIDAQGNLQQYAKTYEDTGERTGKFTITKAWTESDGWIWFKDTIHYDDADATVYELSKLDTQMMDWTLLWSPGDYPSEWDAVEHRSYFYRK